MASPQARLSIGSLRLNDRTLEQIKFLEWEDVVGIWQSNEDYPGSHWEPIWKAKGFTSWLAWRGVNIQKLGLDALNWSLWSIPFPAITIREFHGGPYRGWAVQYYEGHPLPKFSQLAGKMKEHPFVTEFLSDSPLNTTVTGLVRAGEIIIIEGMHRCCAFAAASRQKHYTLRTHVNICLAQWPDDKNLPLL